MASDPITGAARYLFDAAQAKQQGAPFPAGLAPPDVATAYLVQDILQALWVEAGAGKVAG